MSGARWRGLQAPELPDLEVPGPRVERRRVRLDLGTEGVEVDARWRLDADEPGWITLPLASPELLVTGLRWKGREVGQGEPVGGEHTVTLWVEGPGELVLTGVMPGRVAAGEGPRLRLLSAPEGTAELPKDWVLGSEAMAPIGDGSWWGGAADLHIRGRAAAATSRGALVRAVVATGITVDDGSAQVAARVRFVALRGVLAQVQFAVPGAGPDLVVEGPGVEEVARSGDQVTVTLRNAESTAARLDVRWSVSLPNAAAASVAAPRLVPNGVSRAAYVTKLARSGDLEVVPDGSAWRAMALAEVPEWAEGLLQGSATAALSSSGTGGPPSLQLQLLRFEPVGGPATLIDTAQTAVALSDEGRMLMRTHLQVRNDRGATLSVTPPPGARILGVSVAGEVPEPLLDGDTWRLPLKKSVETVDGLLSFPIRIVMVGETPVFDGRTKGALPLPVFDADIAVHRVSLHLPMGHESKLPPDERHVVEAFTEGSGITYGFAVGDARATEADVLFQSAVNQWMSNEFDEAQSSLDELRNLGGGNDDVERLQGNLDLLMAGDDGKESATSRRVKEQAKYRSVEESRQQSRLLEEAEQALLEGDYDAAESNYAQALDIGGKLAKLDAGEDQSNAWKNAEVEKKLKATSSLSKQKKKVQDDATKASREAAERQRVVEAQKAAEEQARVAARRAAEEAAARAAAESERLAVARRAEADQRAQLEQERAKYEAELAEKDRSQAGELGWADGDTAGSPDTAVVVTAEQMAIDTSDTSRSTVLSKEFLERVPSGRSYQSAVQMSAGVGQEQGQGSNPNMAGGASNENTYVLDGVNISDPVAGTEAPAMVEITAQKIEILEDITVATGSAPGVVGHAPMAAPQASPEPPPAKAPVRVFQNATTSGKRRDKAKNRDRKPASTPPAEAPVELLDREMTGEEFVVVGGIVGGVEGGVVGGVLGGVSGADEPMVFEDVMDEELVEEEEAVPDPVMGTFSQSFNYDEADVESRRRGPRLPKMPKGGKKEKKAKPMKYKERTEVDFDSVDVSGELVKPQGQLLLDRRKSGSLWPRKAEPVREPADTIEIAMGGEDDPPDVKATSLDVIVPAQGDTVRYQHLLVPAGEPVRVPIHTRPKRSRRNR